MYNQKENKYVDEWLMIEHPEDLQWTNERLGAIKDKKMANLLKITLRRCDAIYIEDRTVSIVEAKLRNDIGAISQLNEYARLFGETPKFRAFWDYRIKKILLVPFEWRDIARACKENNIELVIFRPEWLAFR